MIAGILHWIRDSDRVSRCEGGTEIESTMSQLPPHFIELVYDAVLKSFWRKPALKRFLRASGISDSALAQLDPSDTKRVWLDELFPKLEAVHKGRALINQMARSLASSFHEKLHNN